MKVNRDFCNSTEAAWETLVFYAAFAAPTRPEGSGGGRLIICPQYYLFRSHVLKIKTVQPF